MGRLLKRKLFREVSGPEDKKFNDVLKELGDLEKDISNAKFTVRKLHSNVDDIRTRLILGEVEQILSNASSLVDNSVELVRISYRVENDS